MLLNNRHGSVDSDAYRYGFQGQERDDEVKGEGNSHNYTFRMHDPRLGRFFSPDPLENKYAFYTPYQFSGNKVIYAKELEGKEELVAIPADLSTSSPAIFTESVKTDSYAVMALGIEKLETGAVSLSYKVAFETLADGHLFAANGKVYTTQVIVTKDIQLINGTLVKNVDIGQNWGNQITTTKYYTAAEQVELFRPNKLIRRAALAEAVGAIAPIAGWIDHDTNELNAKAMLGDVIVAGIALEASAGTTAIAGLSTGLGVGLLMAGFEITLKMQKAEQDTEIMNDFIRLGTSLEDMRGIVENNDQYKNNFGVYDVTLQTLEKFVTGEITDLQKLQEFDFEQTNRTQMSALLIQYTDDNEQAFVRSMYVPDPEKKE